MSGANMPRELSPAVTQASAYAAEDTFPTDTIVNTILHSSRSIIAICARTKNFGVTEDDEPFAASLRTLLTRLERGYLTLNSLPTRLRTEAHIVQSTQAGIVSIPIEDRDLSDFEDVYYSLLARMHEMHQIIRVRLQNDFGAGTDPVHIGGPSSEELMDMISATWDVLNDPKCARALDIAVKRTRSFATQSEIMRRVNNPKELQGQEEVASELLQQIFDGNIPGLDWTPDWLPAFVNAKLSEKYRATLLLEKSEAERNRKTLMSKIKAAKDVRAKAAVDAKKADLARKYHTEQQAKELEKMRKKLTAQEEAREKYKVEEEERRMREREQAGMLQASLQSVQSHRAVVHEATGDAYLVQEQVAEMDCATPAAPFPGYMQQYPAYSTTSYAVPAVQDFHNTHFNNNNIIITATTQYAFPDFAEQARQHRTQLPVLRSVYAPGAAPLSEAEKMALEREWSEKSMRVQEYLRQGREYARMSGISLDWRSVYASR